MNNNSLGPYRCECHECTQARYRMSMQFQMDNAMRTNPYEDCYKKAANAQSQEVEASKR